MQIQIIRAHSLRAIHNKYPAPVVNQRAERGEIDPIAGGIIHPIERQDARAGGQLRRHLIEGHFPFGRMDDLYGNAFPPQVKPSKKVGGKVRARHHDFIARAKFQARSPRCQFLAWRCW